MKKRKKEKKNYNFLLVKDDMKGARMIGGGGGLTLLGINIYFNSISSLDGTILPSHARCGKLTDINTVEGGLDYHLLSKRLRQVVKGKKPITF